MAETLLARVLDRLAAECAERGDWRFDVLWPFLSAGEDPPALAEAAAQLNLTLAAFTSLLHRFRQRYRELLVEEVGQTVGSAGEVVADADGHVLLDDLAGGHQGFWQAVGIGE